MKKVIAIVTVYYPQKEHIVNINIIKNQVDIVIICDNSSFNNEALFKHLSGVQYIYWGKNLGLSKSFNNILKNDKFQWHADDYIIFFDQDTTIPLNHINSLIKDYEYLLNMGYKVGCIGPAYYNKTMQQMEIPKVKKYISNSIIKVRNIITTSMICQYSKIETIKFWNEDIFLDLADFDLCWRFNNENMACFMTFNSVIEHSVGEGKENILFFSLRISKPFREYYQTRDCLYLLSKNYVPCYMKLRFVLNLTLRPILHLIFLNHSIDRFKFIVKGFKDYLNKVHGEIILK